VVANFFFEKMFYCSPFSLENFFALQKFFLNFFSFFRFPKTFLELFSENDKKVTKSGKEM